MNCPDWEQDGEDCPEFEENAAAMRDLNVPPAAFAAVRQRVLSEIQVKKRRSVWWTWPAVAAAVCIAIVCVSYLLPRWQNPAAPEAVVAKTYPPKFEWPLAKPVIHRVRHKNSGRSLAQAGPVRKTEPLAVVKMLTDDPNVIIIWLVDQKGDSL